MKNFNYYLITDPTYYTNDLKKFEEKLKNVLTNKRVDITCFRDKTSSNINELAKVFIKVCKEYKIQNIFLNQNIHLAKELNYDGVQLTSIQFDEIHSAKQQGLKTIISCHTFRDMEEAVRLKPDMVTFSPIFETPNKGEPKGIELLKVAQNDYDIDIIALGGIIGEEQIKKIKDSKVKGFASIRYFI